MSAYKKDFDETKYMSFLIKDDELLKKYNEITNNKEFDSDPAYNEKYLKSKIKSYNGKIHTNFHNDKIPKEGSQCICFSVILIDSVFRTGKNYYPQVFLEECKYVVKEKKMSKYIIDDIEISDEKNSYEEISDEENSDEGNSKQENSYEENSKRNFENTFMVKLIFKAYKQTDKIFFIIFFLYIKILTGYYQNTQKKLSKKARERYQNLSEEEKDKKHQHARERYRNLSGEEKETIT